MPGPGNPDLIAGLREELRGYEIHGRHDRAAEVRAELDRLGAAAPAPPGAPETSTATPAPERAVPEQPAPAGRRGGRTKKGS